VLIRETDIGFYSTSLYYTASIGLGALISLLYQHCEQIRIDQAQCDGQTVFRRRESRQQFRPQLA
jgi:hypothetical protein